MRFSTIYIKTNISYYIILQRLTVSPMKRDACKTLKIAQQLHNIQHTQWQVITEKLDQRVALREYII